MAMAAIDFQLLANAGFPPATFKPGEVIFTEGDKGDKMYVIRSGEVEIERDGTIVEKLSQGGIFGEMALIDGSPRAATARAATPCEVAPITEKSFLFRVQNAILRHCGNAHSRRTVEALPPPRLTSRGCG
jgi:CRP/FNR family cyclic AMP-dependent transcriptional regulator